MPTLIQDLLTLIMAMIMVIHITAIHITVMITGGLIMAGVDGAAGVDIMEGDMEDMDVVSEAAVSEGVDLVVEAVEGFPGMAADLVGDMEEVSVGDTAVVVAAMAEAEDIAKSSRIELVSALQVILRTELQPERARAF